MLKEYRKILLDGYPTQVEREANMLIARDGRKVGVEEAIHLPPVQPTKIICTHLNFYSRAEEFDAKLPPEPTYFQKPITSLTAHKSHVVRPEPCKFLNYEGEIAIVIGKTCRNISQAEAGEYIAGYSIANDYGLHDFRHADWSTMLRVKGGDTHCPLGPGLVTGWNFKNKTLRTLVNGKVVQEDNTDNMGWDMHYLVADIARTITLVPGDILLSGTPANSRPVQPGDICEVEVEGLGKLSNTIVTGPTPIRNDVGTQPQETDEILDLATGRNVKQK